MKKVLAFLLLSVSCRAQMSFPVNGTVLNLAGNKTNLTNAYSILAPSLSSPLAWTLPNANGTSGEFLRTDGAGNLSWASAASSGMTNPMTSPGDVIIGGTGGTPMRLGMGTIGAMLLVYNVGGSLQPAWTANPMPFENVATLATGNNDNVPVTYNALALTLGTGVTSATVTGISVPPAYNVVRLFNNDPDGLPITITNYDANSSAGNRLITLTGSNESIPQGGVKFFTYETSAKFGGEDVWVETSSHPPEPPSGMGSVTSITAGTGLTGGTITTTGTIALSIPVTAPSGGTGLTSYTTGDVLYANASTSLLNLAGNTTATDEFFRSTGNGVSAVAPSWSALASADIPNNAANTTGTASNVTGIITVPHGGTGRNALTAYGVLVGEGTGAIDNTSGADGDILAQIGSGDPTFVHNPYLGSASNTGSLQLVHSTVGVVTLYPAASGTWTLTFPNSSGMANQFMQTDGSGNGSWNYAGLAIYGDGSDGSVTFDGISTLLGMVPSGNVYTMTRDITCTSIHVDPAVTIKTAGFRMFATQAISNSGSIANNAATTSGVFGAGGSGGIAVKGPANGNAGGPTSMSAGGGGGAGGTSGVGNLGGAGGLSTAPTAANGSIHATAGWLSPLFGTTTSLSGGAGGGSGGADALSDDGVGGAGGGVLFIAAPIIDNTNGTISANGGAGTNATAGNAGGGGGGGGGVVCTISNHYTGAKPIVMPGTGGSGFGAGLSGTPGTPGAIIQITN